MKWKILTHLNLRVGGAPVLIRTLRLTDELGRWRRHRVCTVQEYSSTRGTRIPAWAKLAKDEGGAIGVLVSGAHFGLLKLGRFSRAQPYLHVSLDALSKKAQRKLLVPLDCELVQNQDLLLAKERKDEPYYVGSRTSTRFHYPGCPRAARILVQNKVVFTTREDAVATGALSCFLCRP